MRLSKCASENRPATVQIALDRDPINNNACAVEVKHVELKVKNSTAHQGRFPGCAVQHRPSVEDSVRY